MEKTLFHHQPNNCGYLLKVTLHRLAQDLNHMKSFFPNSQLIALLNTIFRLWFFKYQVSKAIEAFHSDI